MTETVEQRIQFLEQHLSSKPRSPLFAQLAGYYLEAGKTSEALDLCDKGLSVYPFYSTGHLVKGKALLALNMPAEARREFEFVQNRFTSIESLALLLRDLPSGGIETLTGHPEEKMRIIKRAPAAAKPAPAEPAAPEASPDKWMSQFTEAAATTPAVEPQAAEPKAPESAETFSFAPETPTEAPADAALTSEDAFGVGMPAPEAPVEPSGPPEALPTQAGESFSDFAERKRGELFGLENSLSLDEYLGTGQPPAVEVSPQVEELPSTESPAVESPAEDPFAALTRQFEEPTVKTETPQASEQASEDPFAQLQQLTEEVPAEPVASSPETAAEDPFAQLSQSVEEIPAAPVSTEEIPATSVTAEDPFAQLLPPVEAAPAPPEISVAERDQIEEIADKLKNAKKITPIIDLSERAPVPPSEAETPSSTGFVTPTLAEIYAKQGWYDDAIKAYKMLAVSKPAEKEKFEKRIQELEELKKQQEPK